MTRTKRNIRGLLQAVHQQRHTASLSAGWRHGVMDEVCMTGVQETPLLRLAPRFTAAAAAVSAIGLAAGIWSVQQLAGDVGNAYASQFLNLASSAWSLL